MIPRGQLTNGHAAMGLTADDDVPALPLRVVAGRSQWGGGTHRVVDAGGAWMADFRNPTDAQRFIAAYGVAPSDGLAPLRRTWCTQNGVNKDVKKCTGNSATCECGTQQFRLRTRGVEASGEALPEGCEHGMRWDRQCSACARNDSVTEVAPAYRQIGWTIDTGSGRLFETNITAEQRTRWQPVYITDGVTASARDHNEVLALVYLYGSHCAEHPEDAAGQQERLAAVKTALGVIASGEGQPS